MRYEAIYDRLILSYSTTNEKLNGRAKHTFENKILVVGDPTTATGTGNAIDASDLVKLFPDGANDLQKAGLGRLFVEAPIVASPASGLVVGRTYRVINGTVTYNGVAYTRGQVFTVVTGVTVTTGTGEIALTVQPPLVDFTADQFETEAARLAHLGSVNEVPSAFTTGRGFANLPANFVAANALFTYPVL